MQAYEGYFEDGNFYPTVRTARVPGRRRAFVTVLDEPAQDETVLATQDNAMKKQLAAIDEFIAAIKASNEEVPEFERIKLREVEI